MEELLKLDYFYGDEPDNFCFYRIPKVLFTKAYFQDLSTDAKVLYGLMLDTMSSSRMNRWVDDENRVYIQFSIQRAMAYLGCGKDKAIKLFAELDCKKGIGLIERIDRGQGKADIIYVKSFEISKDAEDNARIKRIKDRQRAKSTSGQNVQKLENVQNPETGDPVPAVAKTDRSENQTTAVSGSVVGNADQSDKSTPFTTGKVAGKPDRYDFPASGSLESRPLEVGFSDPNNTDHIKTDFSDHLSVMSEPYGRNERTERPTGYTAPIRLTVKAHATDGDYRQEIKEGYIRLLRDQVRYDELLSDDYYRYDRDMIDGIINMIADIVAFPSPTGTEWINSREIPYETVKSRLTKLNHETLTYAIDSLRDNYSEIRNKRAYLLTALYNAQDEMQFGYMSRVNHDFYGKRQMGV
ncbi:MAG: replication initiator protein A [Lachnospiraceae bacterium]|nr:replication initiator protein A [Lachnospiraceae bacterium]